MSIDGFVQTCRARLDEIEEQMAAMIKRDGGKPVGAHLRPLKEEADTLRQAIQQAMARGVQQ